MSKGDVIVHWNRMMATVITASAVAAVSIGTSALAAPAPAPGHLGLFISWHAAQEAADFPLIRPTKTFGLKRNGRIVVTRCVTGPTKDRHARRLVIARYGNTPRAQLMLSQNNTGHPCGSIGKVTSLGTVRVHGVKARLSGLCGRDHLPRCSAKNIFLFLTWTKHHIFYVASSFGKSRGILIAFARGTVPVG
jgi:hypothetical protein